MLKQFRMVQAGDQEFEVTWDMVALHTVEKIDGKLTTLETIHAAIFAAAAHREKPAPVTLLKLGSLFASIEEQQKALAVVMEVCMANGMAPSEGKAEPPLPAATIPTFPDATSLPASISESAMASSGV